MCYCIMAKHNLLQNTYWISDLEKNLTWKIFFIFQQKTSHKKYNQVSNKTILLIDLVFVSSIFIIHK